MTVHAIFHPIFEKSNKHQNGDTKIKKNCEENKWIWTQFNRSFKKKQEYAIASSNLYTFTASNTSDLERRN